MTSSTRPATRASADKFGPSRTPTSIPTGPGRPGEAFTEKSARACGTAPGTATSTSKPARGTMTRSDTAAAHFKACSPWSIAFMFTAWGLARAGFSIQGSIALEDRRTGPGWSWVGVVLAKPALFTLDSLGKGD